MKTKFGHLRGKIVQKSEKILKILIKINNFFLLKNGSIKFISQVDAPFLKVKNSNSVPIFKICTF